MRRITPEEKVRIAIELTDAATSITAQGIRDSHPGITEEEVLEELRRRFAHTRSREGRDHPDPGGADNSKRQQGRGGPS